MKVEHSLFVILVAFLTAFAVFFMAINRPQVNIQKESKSASTNDSNLALEFRQRFKRLEESLDTISSKQASDETALATLEARLNSPKESVGKKILATAKTQGSLFTTSSPVYGPMGMYVTINCPVACSLWIDFFSSSKNQGTPNTAQGYMNTYGVFVDGVDKSIYGQATFPAAGSAVPVSLNGLVSVSAGVHTIDVQAKTTGGTLESSSSFLQVMAVE